MRLPVLINSLLNLMLELRQIRFRDHYVFGYFHREALNW